MHNRARFSGKTLSLAESFAALDHLPLELKQIIWDMPCSFAVQPFHVFYRKHGLAATAKALLADREKILARWAADRMLARAEYAGNAPEQITLASLGL